jgi:hypothetical protein
MYMHLDKNCSVHKAINMSAVNDRIEDCIFKRSAYTLHSLFGQNFSHTFTVFMT